MALLEQAVTPLLLHKYTEQERDLVLLTLRLGVRGFCILFQGWNSTLVSINSFNLHGHWHRDKVCTLLGSIWTRLEPCHIRALKDEASLLPRLSVAWDPVENGLFFVGLRDCLKERIPYTGI